MNLWKKFLLLGCLITHMNCAAISQEIIDPAPAQLITEFPFQILTGGVILVSAKMSAIPDSLHFILDTGSGGISLDSATVEIYNVHTEPSDRIIRGIAGIRFVSYAYNHSLYLPGLTVDSLNFHVNDYQVLTEVHGIKIDGIIGYALFSRYIVKVDYDKRLLQILTPGFIRYPKGGSILQPSLGTIPVVSAHTTGTRNVIARYYLDTGAGLNILFSSAFLRDSSIVPAGRKLFPTVAQGLGGKTYLDLTLLKRVKIGRYTFRKIPVHVFDDDYNVTSYPFLAGLLGNDLLRRFNLIINYPDGKIHMLPNSAFTEQFDYSYTGLGMMNLGGSIEVSDVLPGSPAEKAGLQVGDKILGVGNNVTGNLQTYRTNLQVSGTNVKILGYRDNKLFEAVVKVARIK